MDLAYLRYLGICADEPLADAEELASPDSLASDEVLFESGNLRVPERLSNAFFEVSFALCSVAPPCFDTTVEPVLQGEWRFQILGLDVQAVSDVLSAMEVLKDLSRRDFLAGAALPAMFRAVPPAAVLCRIFALAQVHGFNLVLPGHESSQEFVCCYFDAMCLELGLRPHHFAELYAMSEVLPGVFSLHTESRLVLGSSFLRFQEHYECSNPQFRHCSFQLDDYKVWFRNKSLLGFNFYLQWPGFNVPSWVLDAMRSGKVGFPLRPQEEAVLSTVPPTAQYLIGSCEKDLEVLHHEMAHGLYATNETYRTAVLQQLRRLPPKRTEASKRQLLKMGYVDDIQILEDEMQAYMVEGKMLYEEDELECSTAVEVMAAIHATFRLFSKAAACPSW
ncbi:unnamed protein product [Effrenium voratum]|uniref:Uncharacterized protein n=1 Tax=Effrenium voratum TaxID=2562239 RepID=A0AA36NHX8_9DINO|nr:unnamed protein product [Effrenium voratum]CAJ1426101.1 unnamed protein product [Effrenium voratum]